MFHPADQSDAAAPAGTPAPADALKPGWIVVALIALAGIAALIGYNLHVRAQLHRIVQPVAKLDDMPTAAFGFGQNLYVAGSNRTVRLIRHGQDTAHRLFDAPISAACTDASAQRLYLGDNDGNVYLTDAMLEGSRSIQVAGRVTGLALIAPDRLVICYGGSAKGPDYYVTVVDASLPGGPVAQGLCTDFCTPLMTGDGRQAVYGTVNGRLGAVDGQDHQVWQHVLEQQPLALAATSGSQPVIAVGDSKGGLSLLDADGRVLWTRAASRFAVRQLALAPDQQMIVGADIIGRVFFYNRQGQLLFAEPESVQRSQVAAFAAFTADGPDMVALRYDGQVQRLALAQATGLRFAGTFRVLLPLGLLALALLAGAGTVLSSARLTARARRIGARLWAARLAYALLIPTFLLLIVFKYYPVGTAFSYSFTNFSLTKPSSFVGLHNYTKMLDDQYVKAGMSNMLIFLVTNLVKTLTVPLLVAELIFWTAGDRIKQIFRTAFVMPSVVPGVVFVLLWVQIYSPTDGLINNILFSLHWLDRGHPITWLSNEHLALWSIVLSGFPWVSVFAFLILMGGLIGIPTDVFEAARIDGAGRWRRFWRIDLPMIMPQIKLLTIFTFIGSIQDFTRVLIFTNGGPGMATYVPALQMFRQIADGADLGYASAIGAVLFVIVLIFTVFILRGWRTYDG